MFKSRRQPVNPLSAAPWIYVNDPSGSHQTASLLTAMIPGAFHFDASKPGANSKWAIIQESCFQSGVMVISDNMIEEKHMPILFLKEKSIERGSNFVSIDLDPRIENSRVEPEGVHHIRLHDSDSCSTKIYQWLFTVLTVPEQLHLIPVSQMEEIDPNSNFKDYAYCAIANARKTPKNAKIQFVALVLTKPEIGTDQRLHWQVMDKTGTANFYFQYRGTASQYTWDWVNSLKPGDRKCLPRMPMIKVKESTVATIAKAPFRLTAGIVVGSGVVVKSIGSGLCKAGKKIKLGNRSKWVADIPTGPNDEFTYDAKGHKVVIPKNTALVYQWPKVNVRVFNEKGEKVWDDDDSVVSTAASSADNDIPAGWKDEDGESKRLMLG